MRSQIEFRDPTFDAAVGRLARRRDSDWYYRRASRRQRAAWAQMAGKQNAPSPGRPEAFTTSTDTSGPNGCNSDGA